MADLSAERIANAALELVDSEGVSAFTLRGVARRLNVTPMALYHHVADKEELAALVVDAVVKSVPRDDGSGDWKEDLWLMSRWMRAYTLKHPSVGQLRRAHRVWTPLMLSTTNDWFGYWRQSGLNEENTIKAAGACGLAIYGLINEELNIRNMTLPKPELLERIRNVQAVFEQKPDVESMFELTVRSVIDGVFSRLSAEQNA
ncbi:TetR/AcrR family transcriptional regulator [Ponticaulis sp.]|uniref:TetR/AcrR family transcriptional regulator n=1 Tax=Ponticaulis sp. TaxID=2020902 RepID=UPI0026289F7F|nr:TetR/AcrR family transcriptional regulator [Ponticaulis sp.]MDF1681681.1 TetR/AcrR family transcriptional regulator [Ponticaulis sp.]